MRRHTRYSLIIIGIVFFLIVAPLTVFYVRGVRYNFTTKHYLSTGIFAINTDPKGAELYQDGKPIATTPSNVRFISQGEYTLTVKKDGYRDWSKRLPVWEGKVTWIHSGNAIYLLKADPQTQTLARDAVDFVVDKKTLYYLSPTSLIVTSVEPDGNVTNIPLAASVNELHISPNGKWLLLTGPAHTLLYDAGSKTITDISTLIGNTPKGMVFVGDNLLYITNSTLTDIALPSLNKSVLTKNVEAVTALDNQLYFIMNNGTGEGLYTAPLAHTDETTLILAQVPKFFDPKIVVTNQKQVLLLGDQTLYRVNSQLDRITDNVTSMDFSPNSQTLTYSTSNESYYYDFTDSSAHLIIRSGTPSTSPRVNITIGYSFFYQNQQLVALETDTRDHQNSYNILAVEKPKKLELGADDEHIYVLDGTTIKTLTIR